MKSDPNDPRISSKALNGMNMLFELATHFTRILRFLDMQTSQNPHQSGLS